MALFDLDKMLYGRVWPPHGPYPESVDAQIQQGAPFPEALPIESPIADKIESTIFSTPMAMPLKMKLKSENENAWWLLPVEPMISIGGKNIIVKRNVAKSKLRGSIKERWAQDDYTIEISGLFTTPNALVFPVADLQRLKAICEAKEPVDVLCPLFEPLGITRMVIEGYDLPFTKGIENQNWKLDCISDDDWDLLIKLDTI